MWIQAVNLLGGTAWQKKKYDHTISDVGFDARFLGAALTLSFGTYQSPENTLTMPKAGTSRAAAAARRHNPLAEDISSAGHLRTQSSKKGKGKAGNDEDGENGQGYIDAKMSRNILQMGQELADEDAAEQKLAQGSAKSNGAFEFDTRFEEEEPFSDDEGKFGADDWVDDEVEEVVRAFNLPLDIVYTNISIGGRSQ